MLETLVSSRIRRALFEYILSHPNDRFYLRGLAKELGLSVSPLRRELKRLECSGMLKAAQEGNMLFYTVDQASPAFLQLMQAGRQAEAPSPVASTGLGAQGSGMVGAAPEPMPVPLRTASASPRVSLWRSSLSHPALVGAAGVGAALLLIIAGLLHLTATHQRLASQASRALATRRAEVTVVVPPASPSSGAMRGVRWQIVPGGFGGFSSGASDDSY